MDEARLVKISKYLSKHLRHQPERLGLTLEQGGWVRVEDLLEACAAHGMAISRGELEEVVERNDKQRFSLNPEGDLIRANQGHSVDVDLQLEPKEPPEVLYHGTAVQVVPAIQREGLKKMSRHHVHLSSDAQTARTVGGRHGRTALFLVQAKKMHDDGYTFYRSANGVWLTDHVPPKYMEPV